MAEPWKPDETYFVLTPRLEVAKDILRIDHEIRPNLHLLRLTGSVDRLRGMRNIPVFVIDPDRLMSKQDYQHLHHLRLYGNVRHWVKEDFDYLKEQSIRVWPANTAADPWHSFTHLTG